MNSVKRSLRKLGMIILNFSWVVGKSVSLGKLLHLDSFTGGGIRGIWNKAASFTIFRGFMSYYFSQHLCPVGHNRNFFCIFYFITFI